jgi:hypothetical protein
VLAESPTTSGVLVAVSLDQLFGSSAGTGNPDDRVGQFAWTAAYPPSAAEAPQGAPGVYGALPALAGAAVAPTADAGSPIAPDASPDAGADAAATGSTDPWRAYELRVQASLQAFASLPISWAVVYPDMIASTGEFQPLVASVDASNFGYHESLITDYQATNVPGFGTLPAGTPATKAQQAAALDPSAEVTFLRIKNSWGVFAPAAAVPGYDDLDISYLEGGVTVTSGGQAVPVPSLVQDIVLPAGF